MKRTTISLPDDLGSELEREAHRRRTSQSEVVRDALRDRFGLNGGKRHIGFAAIGASSGDGRIAANADEILAEIYEERARRRRDPGDR